MGDNFDYQWPAPAAYIEGESGRLFDPELIAAFRAARGQLREYVARIVL